MTKTNQEIIEIVLKENFSRVYGGDMDTTRETLKDTLLIALSLKDNQWREAVEGMKKEVLLEYAKIKEDAKFLDTDSHEAFISKSKINAERQSARDVVMAKINTLQDVLNLKLT